MATVTLTTGLDTITPTFNSTKLPTADAVPGNEDDTFKAGSGTLTMGDELDGGEGTNVLKIYDGSDYTAFANASIKNIQIVEGYGTGATLDVSGNADVKEVWAMKADTSSTDANLLQKIGLADALGAAAEKVGFKGANTANDSATIMLKDAGKTAAYTSLTVDNTGTGVGAFATIENLTIEATGKNEITTLTAASAADWTISGTGTLKATLDTGNTTIKSVNASQNAGGVDLKLTVADLATTGATIKGGSGDDKIALSAATTVKVNVDLGTGDDTFTSTGNLTYNVGSNFAGGEAGKDTLILSNAATSIAEGVGSMFTGFEVLQLEGTANAYAKGAVAGITDYVLASGTSTLSNFVSGDAFTVSANATAIVALADSTALEELHFTLDNGAKTAAAGAVATLDVTGVETLNFHSAGLVNATGNGVTLSDNSLAGVISVKIDGTQDFTLTTGDSTALTSVVSAGTGNITVDASGMIKSVPHNKISITTGDGNDVISGAVGADTSTAKMNTFVDAGKGADIIKLAETGTNNVGDHVIIGKGDSISTAYDTISKFDHGAADIIDLTALGLSSKTVGAAEKAVAFTGAATNASAMSVAFSIAEDQRAGFFATNAIVYKTGADGAGTAGTATMVFVDANNNNNWDDGDTVILLVGDYDTAKLAAEDFAL